MADPETPSEIFREPLLHWRNVHPHVVPGGVDKEHEDYRRVTVERAARYISKLQAYIDRNGGTQ
jgi:hypothetical protein